MRIKGSTGQLRFTWNLATKMVFVCVLKDIYCVYLRCHSRPSSGRSCTVNTGWLQTHIRAQNEYSDKRSTILCRKMYRVR